jgi:hypothetical protein
MATGAHTRATGGPLSRVFSRNAEHFVSLVRGRLAGVVVTGQLGQSRDIEVARLTGARR